MIWGICDLTTVLIGGGGSSVTWRWINGIIWFQKGEVGAREERKVWGGEGEEAEVRAGEGAGEERRRSGRKKEQEWEVEGAEKGGGEGEEIKII